MCSIFHLRALTLISLTQTLRFEQSAENRNNESQYAGHPDEMPANDEVEEFAYQAEASPAAAGSPPQVVRSRVIRLLRSPSSVPTGSFRES